MATFKGICINIRYMEYLGEQRDSLLTAIVAVDILPR